MKSLPSSPWRKVRHQAIGDRIIKLTNRCVWVIDVSNPLGGPQGKCQLINNMLPWTGSSLLQPVSLPLPRGANPRPVNLLLTYYIQKGMKDRCFPISPSLKSPTKSLESLPYWGRKKAHANLIFEREKHSRPQVKKMKKLSLYLLLSDSEPDSSGKNILPVTVTGIQSSCLIVCHLLHCLKKNLKMHLLLQQY